jgi:uncharacterized protein (TIGR03905 family)
MTHRYKTRGTCSREITFDLEDGVVKNIRFQGGCNGNTKGIATLAEGMEATELIRRLQGLDCNGRGTSCPDQLAKAVEQVLQQQ